MSSLVSRVQERFQEIYDTTPLLYKASGRVNIIGEHTDYNLGLSLPFAVDRAIYYAAKMSDSQLVRVYSLDKAEQAEFRIGESYNLPNHWSSYFGALLEVIRDKGLNIKGMDLVFGGDLPIGAGLSSSAALCCGFMYALNEQNELGLSKEEMAKIAQLTEHRIGLMCGLLDQYSVLFGEEDHALQVDFQSLEVQVQPAALEDGEWILINSRVEHNLAGDSPYNARRESCQRVVDTVAADHPHVRSLRDITPEQLQAYQPQLSEVDFRRASFVMGENRRVHEVVESFAQKDAARLGASLYQSQDEQRELYEITTSEIDTLVDFVKEEAAVWGARQTGGGFGGCVICLVKPGNLKAIERVVEKYKVATGIQAEIYPVKASQGIRRLHVV